MQFSKSIYLLFEAQDQAYFLERLNTKTKVTTVALDIFFLVFWSLFLLVSYHMTRIKRKSLGFKRKKRKTC